MVCFKRWCRRWFWLCLWGYRRDVLCHTMWWLMNFIWCWCWTWVWRRVVVYIYCYNSFYWWFIILVVDYWIIIWVRDLIIWWKLIIWFIVRYPFNFRIFLIIVLIFYLNCGLICLIIMKICLRILGEVIVVISIARKGVLFGLCLLILLLGCCGIGSGLGCQGWSGLSRRWFFV